jgi:FAD/FMN-containing dehydrogenase
MDFLMLLTFCRNCSLKPSLRGFFSCRRTAGAAAAAAAGTVGKITDCAVRCLATDVVTTVADADDGSFVVNEMSPHLIRDCLSSSGLDDTLLESSLSTSNPSFLRVLDGIIPTSINLRLNGVRG